VWSEIWPDIGPLIEQVFQTSVATYSEGMLLILERSGHPEEMYHTFSYSPVFDEQSMRSQIGTRTKGKYPTTTLKNGAIRFMPRLRSLRGR
jgi:hypothetical protein